MCVNDVCVCDNLNWMENGWMDWIEWMWMWKVESGKWKVESGKWRGSGSHISINFSIISAAYLIPCTVFKCGWLSVKFSLATGGCFTLTSSLGWFTDLYGYTWFPENIRINVNYEKKTRMIVLPDAGDRTIVQNGGTWRTDGKTGLRDITVVGIASNADSL